MKRIMYIFIILFSLTVQTLIAEEEICEVIGPDGSVHMVSCCTISRDGDQQNSNCGEFVKELDSTQVKALEKVIKTTINR